MYASRLQAYYPNYAFADSQAQAIVVEPSSDAKVTKAEFYNAQFDVIDNRLIKDLASLHDGTATLLDQDCDGCFVTRSAQGQYVCFAELKSGFDTNKIYKAIQQIISTSVKANMLLRLLPEYSKSATKAVGFIMMRPMTSDFVRKVREHRQLKKPLQRHEQMAWTFIQEAPANQLALSSDKSTAVKALALSSHVIFDEIKLHFIPVPAPSASVAIDISSYLH